MIIFQPRSCLALEVFLFGTVDSDYDDDDDDDEYYVNKWIHIAGGSLYLRCSLRL